MYEKHAVAIAHSVFSISIITPLKKRIYLQTPALSRKRRFGSVSARCRR